MAFWQQERKLTVPGSGTARFVLDRQAVLDRVTIWVVSGARTVANLSFQVQINRRNFNSAVTVVGAVAADVIFQSGGAATENDLIPFRPAARRDALDDFEFSVLATNADAAAVEVTFYATGLT